MPEFYSARSPLITHILLTTIKIIKDVNYIWLGVYLDSSLTLKEHHRTRMRKARQAEGRLRRLTGQFGLTPERLRVTPSAAQSHGSVDCNDWVGLHPRDVSPGRVGWCGLGSRSIVQ